MPKFILYTALSLLALTTTACTEDTEEAGDPLADPQYTADGQLIRPENYREWTYITSGHGMSYNPELPANANPPFDNVFVPPDAYQSFKQTGSWPDKTIFVLEIRAAASQGSINKAGHFQGDLVVIEAEVKDEARFPKKWAYFDFGPPGGPPAPTALPREEKDCFSCHDKNAAVEHTFVQFYPTLFEIAESKGTVRPDYPK